MDPLGLTTPATAELLRLRGRVALVWVVTLFLTQAFVGAGYLKLGDSSGWTQAFLEWGYPDWFRRTIGVLELLGGLLILWPRVAFYGALLIFAVMVGAVATHFRVGEFMDAFNSDLPSLSFSASLIFVRWPFPGRPSHEGLGRSSAT